MKRKAILFAILAAVFYALGTPVSKLLLGTVPATYMASFLYLGAAKTSAFYAIAPFIGVMLSFVLVGEKPGISYFAALAIMIAGTALVVWDTLKKEKDK